MVLPIGFIARLAVPLVAAVLLMRGDAPETATLLKDVLESSDRVLSAAKGEGEGPTENYDYIIVGAGSAGAILANRLTADGTTTVLLLEAGGDPNPLSDVPMAMNNMDAAGMILGYTSVPSTKACVVLFGGECIFPRGKALGGSSSVNGLVYNRCSSKDYDSWANFTGDPIWRFDSVVDAYRAIESYHGFYEDSAGPNHGTTGELYIGKMEYTPGVDTFFEAVAEQGIPAGDLNSGTVPYGFGKIDYNVKDGQRHSTYHAFLEPILNRTNLVIYRYAWVTKVNIDAVSKQAQGVTYERHGQQRYAGANKEVILAAGVIDSPKILMLSGIGPADHLSQFGIPLVLDLPVGNYLQEHTGVNVHPFTINQTFGLVDPFTPENIEEYATNGTGPLFMIPWWGRYVSHLAMGNIPSQTWNDPTWPDLHVYINEELVAREGQQPEESIFPEVELVRTNNQAGTLRLASTDPKDFPVIDPKFYEDPIDLERHVEGIEFMVNFFLSSPTYQKLGIRWSDRAIPIEQCQQFEFASHDYWKCYVTMMSSTGLHPTSTCRMGPNNTVAVVDSKLKVFGATRLRVIDSSAIPFAPNGNTNLPSMLIGEMGARIILGTV